MVEQTPNEEVEAQGPRPAGAPEPAVRPAPARHGPPVVESKATLNARGEATAAILARVASPHVEESGGRDDIPWIVVDPEHLLATARRCKEHRDLQMDLLHLLFAVDYVEHLQVVYVLFSLSRDRKAMLKVNLPPDDPFVDSVTSLWEAAAWYERETHDLFGIDFEGNDDLAPLLLFEGFEGFPGRRSFPLHEYEEW